MVDSIMSIDENSSLDKLEITKNPFDSNLYDRENFPVLDSSVFCDDEKERKSTEEFRWSIDQIAKLKPAEMDLFPNQEYSIAYEKKEDEERDQRQVDEYFKNVLLPSPWLENRNEILKRVTFSPHPPTTKYISRTEESDMDNGSPVHLSNKISTTKMVATKNDETMLSDACCQTVLTFPMDFNLESIIPKQFYSYVENDNEAKELMVSSLRRKLFGQDNTPVKTKPSDSISPGYATSSPTKDSPIIRNHLSLNRSFDNESPSLSPVNLRNGNETPSVFGSDDGDEFSPIKQASDMGTPNHFRADISLSPVMDGPNSNCEPDDSDYSFLPDVSFDINDDSQDECRRESSRAVRFNAHGISPIRFIANDKNIHVNNTDSMEDSCVQSVKESTARNLHSIFDISSINNTNSNDQCSQNDFDDKGPLHISELSSDAYDVTLPSSNMENSIQNSDKRSNSKDEWSDTSPNVNSISPTDLPTPLKSILKKREDVTPFRTNLKNFEGVENTKFNTECNSGRRHVKAESSKIIKEGVARDLTTYLLPKPVLSEKQENSMQPYAHDWIKKIENGRIFDNIDPVCAHANSVLKRAHKISSNSIDLDFDEKENFFFPNRREIKLNSTEVNSNDFSQLSLEKLTNSNISMPIDSGVGTMENITSQSAISRGSSMNTPLPSRFTSTATPTLPFDRLTLNSVSPWSSKYKFQKPNLSNKWRYRYILTRSRSWPDGSNIPKSRVTPRFMPRQIALSQSPFHRRSNISSLDTLEKGYRDLLQSPLK